MKILKSFWTWLAACVVVLALSFVSAPSASTSSSRIAHLETLVKCPSCEDLSVAISNSTSAIAVRNQISTDVHRGKSDNQILTSLENTYGTQILLSPSTSGIGAILWLAPLGVVLVVVVVGLRLRKRTQ